MFDIDVGMDWYGIELSRSDFGDDLRSWLAFRLLVLCGIRCRDKRAALDLLYYEADQIVEQVRTGQAPTSPGGWGVMRRDVDPAPPLLSDAESSTQDRG